MLVVIGDGEELFATILHHGSVEQISVYSQIPHAFQYAEVLIVLQSQLGKLFAVDINLDARYSGVAVVLVAVTRVIQTALTAEFDLLVFHDPCVIFVLDTHLEIWFVDVDAVHQTRGFLIGVVYRG